METKEVLSKQTIGIDSHLYDLQLRNRWARKDWENYAGRTLQTLDWNKSKSKQVLLNLLGLNKNCAEVIVEETETCVKIEVVYRPKFSINKVEIEIQVD